MLSGSFTIYGVHILQTTALFQVHKSGKDYESVNIVNVDKSCPRLGGSFGWASDLRKQVSSKNQMQHRWIFI